MHDPIFLGGRSEIATKDDMDVANDLLETLMAHKETCVGMAANMIGVRKRIIAFLDESGKTPTYTVTHGSFFLLFHCLFAKNSILFLAVRAESCYNITTFV